MRRPIKLTNDTTFEIELFGGDKVEIGDRESADFKPHIKLNRWGGESFIKVSLPTTEKVNPIVKGGKVKFAGADIEAHFYPLEPTTVIAKDKDGRDVEFTQNELGGFEFEVILKKKPASNKIILDIETQGLKFYYQPELTQQEIDEGCIRPDNVVGSYAVYHATRGNMHKGKATAEKYKCGKAFHIYRPKITDAQGKWVWGELNLDEQAGPLTTTIPQIFLDNAVYPVSVDPNFGVEVQAGSTISISNRIEGSFFTCPEVGTGDSITTWIRWYYNGAKAKYALYKKSDASLVAETAETIKASADGYVTDEITLNFTASPSLENIDYFIVAWGDTSATFIYYDSEAGKGGEDSETYGIWPDPWVQGFKNYKFSIYCTYEVAAPPEGQPYISRVQGVQGMRSWGGI